MKMRTASIAGACFLLLGAAGCSKPESQDAGAFSAGGPKSIPSIVLKPKSHGEELRYVTYGPDGKTVSQTRIEYVNGNTAMLYHRADGSLRERIEHYPADKKGKRALRATTLYEADGKTVLYDRTVAPDGVTTERTATLIAKGRHELHYYQKDGKTLVHRRLVEGKRLARDEEFRTDGTLSKLMVRDPRGVIELTEYASDGATRLMTTIKSDSPYAPVKRFVFHPSNGFLHMRIEYSSYQIKVEYLRPDGTLEQMRIFRATTQEVTVYDTKGKPLFAQDWRGDTKDGDFLSMENPSLQEVAEYGADGTVIRRITFHPDGTTPKQVKIPAPGNYASGTYRHYREDGTLEKEEVKESWNKVTSEKSFEQKEGVKEVFPPDFLKPQPLVKPPVLAGVLMPIEPDYERCGEDGC